MGFLARFRARRKAAQRGGHIDFVAGGARLGLPVERDTPPQVTWKDLDAWVDRTFAKRPWWHW